MGLSISAPAPDDAAAARAVGIGCKLPELVVQLVDVPLPGPVGDETTEVKIHDRMLSTVGEGAIVAPVMRSVVRGVVALLEVLGFEDGATLAAFEVQASQTMVHIEDNGR